MIPAWRIDRPFRPQAGQDGHLRVVDAEDGPAGRIVCVVPGHLERQVAPDRVVRLLDEEDAENARLIAAVPELRAVLAALVRWSAQAGGSDAQPWQDARALLARLRDPHATA